MNKKNHDKFYKKLADRDDEMCKICHVPVTIKQLVIDHINNDNSDNRLENLQLLFKSCNRIKELKGKGTVDNLCVSVCETDKLKDSNASIFRVHGRILDGRQILE